MKRCGFSIEPRCINCGHYFWFGEMVFLSEDGRHICQKCSKRENMVQTKILKITAEVDGKQVPLETISTETFEAIKALEKPKEIPVARLAIHHGERRLIFKVTENMIEREGQYVAMSLITGNVSGYWPEGDRGCGRGYGYNYTNVKPL